ncbi:MAG: type II toxin-antitoxin system RelE/ParE family toxin [Ignavibacteria bacterium]|nr:type II toxin-antitoxin system RelE/ParE family toxin [Ignavibacteria bacterium]
MKNPRFKLLVSEEAESDIDDAYTWYELQKKTLGDSFIRSLSSAFQKIKRNPHLYPLVYLDIRKHLIRKFPYCVYFFVDETDYSIRVVSVLHNSRNPNIWKHRI